MSDDKKIKEKFIASYEKQIKEYLKMLLVLMHVTGGQPARGTEITNLTYVNTSPCLEIYILSGTNMFLPQRTTKD